ncbi:hypothetical protein QWT69_05200 [Sporosarcina oncorhynchi]|uniref:Uncharacterized protein n=1 Tax=Sporosarcina oncorhynchi TaxID=3056444 RepID=A0ABZ0L7N7_9BACL|nr:hypothetical protein [Sporosarcina sp. T2O-4]WOV88515.1 hypothetical protein QWT69_05200 [Sporosarcina sp. T2O-4]
MKIRALLLIALLIGGTYVMLQTYNETNEKSFSDLFNTIGNDFNSLIFTKPTTQDSPAETWVVDDEHEVNQLIDFLQNYSIKKLNASEIDSKDEIDVLSIELIDDDGNKITVMIEENIIIQNENLYYEVVDGPLDVNWIVKFFVSNRSF